MKAQGLLRSIRLPLFIMAVIAFLLVFQSVVWPFLTAFSLSILMEPAIRWVERKGAGRTAAVLTVFLILVVLGGFIVLWIIPGVIQDLNKALVKFPGYVRDIQNLGLVFQRVFRRMPGNLQGFINSIFQQGESFLRGILVKFAGGILGAFSRALPLLLVPILSFYISRDLRSWQKSVHRTVNRWLGKEAVVLERSLLVVAGYVRGLIVDSMAVGGLLAVGLLALKIDLALLIGVLAGIFNLIPYFGPIIGAIPALILAGLHSPWHALYVILLFFAVNQIEAMFLVPRLVGKQVGLHPVAIIFLLLFGGKYFGFFGMFLAVPIGAVLQVLLRYYLNNERMGR